MPVAQQHWSELVRGLANPLPAGRVRAARELAKLGPAAAGALPALTAAVEDGDQAVREAAVQAFAALGPTAVAPLVQFLSHSDKYVRRNATWGLGKLGPHARSAMAWLKLSELGWASTTTTCMQDQPYRPRRFGTRCSLHLMTRCGRGRGRGLRRCRRI